MKLLQQLFKTNKPEVPAYKKPAANGNTYYLLECWNQYADLPEKLLPYVDTIRTKNEWEALGFSLEITKYGQVRKLKLGNFYFSFIQADAGQQAEAEAIRTGKRLTANPEHIALLLERGCRPEEFVLAPVKK